MSKEQKELTIYDIVKLVKETEPRFFSNENMSFWGQTFEDFTVTQMDDGRYLIYAPIRISDKTLQIMGFPPPPDMVTVRLFNPETNRLETLE